MSVELSAIVFLGFADISLFLPVVILGSFFLITLSSQKIISQKPLSHEGSLQSEETVHSSSIIVHVRISSLFEI